MNTSVKMLRRVINRVHILIVLMTMIEKAQGWTFPSDTLLYVEDFTITHVSLSCHRDTEKKDNPSPNFSIQDTFREKQMSDRNVNKICSTDNSTQSFAWIWQNNWNVSKRTRYCFYDVHQWGDDEEVEHVMYWQKSRKKFPGMNSKLGQK